MLELEDKIKILKSHVGEYPDFPKNGILFRDLFSIFQKPEVALLLRNVLVEFAKKIQPPVECIVGLDARGFLLGPLIALELSVPFVPIRKKGKLPGKVFSVTYALEYGEDTLQIQDGSIKKGERVLIVDDLLATGGSLSTACKLVEQLEGKTAACLVLMELTDLNGRKNIPVDVHSIIEF